MLSAARAGPLARLPLPLTWRLLLRRLMIQQLRLPDPLPLRAAPPSWPSMNGGRLCLSELCSAAPPRFRQPSAPLSGPLLLLPRALASSPARRSSGPPCAKPSLQGQAQEGALPKRGLGGARRTRAASWCGRLASSSCAEASTRRGACASSRRHSLRTSA